MNRHEAAFLEGALQIGDPILEQRLLIGYCLINAIVASVAGEPRQHSRVSELLYSEKVFVFAGAPTHLASLRRLAGVLDQPVISRRALHSALVDYACLIALENHCQCALAALSLSESIWDASCNEVDALRAFYRHSVMMVRGQKPIEQCQELCFLLAVRARRARSAPYMGFARLLQVDVLMYRGLLHRARSAARRAIRLGERAESAELLANAQLRLGAIEGRAGNFELALEHGASAFRIGHTNALLRQNALNLMGRALIDLGRLDDARRALELASVSERSAVQTLIMIGLMDLALLTGDLPRFERLRARVEHSPIAPVHRTYYLKLAALGRAAGGDVDGARVLLEEGRQLARTFGFNQDYLDLDTELTLLSEREESVRRAQTTVRDTRVFVDDVLHEIARDHRVSAGTLEEVLA